MKNEGNKALSVYCASSPEVDDKFKQAAYEIGRLCALRGWTLVTGAGAEGLMGAVADGCESEGGHTIGIIPRWMVDRGWLRPGLSETIFTDTMAERKQMLRDHSDAVVVLPGGYGTMEEFFETVTAKQLGQFDKPIILLNQDGYYDSMEQWKQTCYDERFVRRESDLHLWTTIQSPAELFPLLETMK